MSRAQVYEVWEDDDGAMLIPADGGWYYNEKLREWRTKDMRFVASFRASSWSRARESYEAILGYR